MEEIADETQVSALVFGRSCRLPLARWVLSQEKGRFFQSQPPKEIGPPTAIRQELARLVAAGLLEEERPDGENRVYYVRTTSQLWEIYEVAVRLLPTTDS